MARAEENSYNKMNMLTEKYTWRSGVGKSSFCNHHNKDLIRK